MTTRLYWKKRFPKYKRAKVVSAWKIFKAVDRGDFMELTTRRRNDTSPVWIFMAMHFAFRDIKYDEPEHPGHGNNLGSSRGEPRGRAEKANPAS